MELLDKAHRVWESEKATRAWLDAHGLPWHPRMVAGPLNRHQESAIAWAKANGFIRELTNGYTHPDWARLREAGVPAWGGAEIREYMLHLGTTDLEAPQRKR